MNLTGATLGPASPQVGSRAYPEPYPWGRASNAAISLDKTRTWTTRTCLGRTHPGKPDRRGPGACGPAQSKPERRIPDPPEPVWGGPDRAGHDQRGLGGPQSWREPSQGVCHRSIRAACRMDLWQRLSRSQVRRRACRTGVDGRCGSTRIATQPAGLPQQHQMPCRCSLVGRLRLKSGCGGMHSSGVASAPLPPQFGQAQV